MNYFSECNDLAENFQLILTNSDTVKVLISRFKSIEKLLFHDSPSSQNSFSRLLALFLIYKSSKRYGISLGVEQIGAADDRRSSILLLVPEIINLFFKNRGFQKLISSNAAGGLDEASRSVLESLTQILPLRRSLFVLTLFAVLSLYRQFLTSKKQVNVSQRMEDEPQESEEELNSVMNKDCSLCLLPIKNMSGIPCGHTFCWNCLYCALKSKNECPICRFPSKTSLIFLLR